MSYPFDPDWVVAPGETLKDWLDERRLTASAGWIFGIPSVQMDRLLAGDEPIDEELARRLSNMTSISARFWLALEHNFRVGLAAGKKWK